MIGEYEIPRGSKLYFGDSARKKRAIENSAVAAFERHGFEEIATPIFSYHQIEESRLIAFADDHNNRVALRADSSLEVVRLISKRLGGATEHRKWFYIQPIFRYPTTEIFQIGAESIREGDLSKMINLCAEILRDILRTNGGGEATLQIGSIALLRQLQAEIGIDREVLTSHEIHTLLARKEAWIAPLVELSDQEQIRAAIAQTPKPIAACLAKLDDLARKCDWQKLVFSPLYYADMSYYDDLYFRFLLGGKQIAMGGGYDNGGDRAAGFAIYTDFLINT
ncbi:hypothetical protein AGMMS50229_08890 [Campylobacterota bacterium]|nr:hypothetical protein AGMMS50229_08890 [Campylobacterota bacterium]